MSGRLLDMLSYIAPPTQAGETLNPVDPRGQRAVTLSAVALEIVLTGDVFLQPADAGGNAGSVDYRGQVRLELYADGDDVIWLVGAKGSALVPDPAATTTIGTAARQAHCIPNGTYYYPWLGAGNPANASIFARGRAGAAILRYRVVSDLPGAR